MVEYFDGDKKMTVSYTNEAGGSSRFSIDKELADAIELTCGLKLCAWVQEQYDSLLNDPGILSRYCRALKIDRKSISRRKIGDILRLRALEFISKNIPDSEFK
ncbi:hypothetical protein GW797_07980 [Candidatus Parcubacteria bacterium]|nr:hypothetical protein [Candidatus Parcubacteria bacterium]